MSKELKPCHLLDRLREWFELYGNQNHERAEEELHLAIDELYEYQQKDQTIADLEAKLAEKEKEIFFYQNVIKKKPETAIEMCEMLSPYERELRKKEIEIEKLNAMINTLPAHDEEVKQQARNELIDEIESELKKRYFNISQEVRDILDQLRKN